MERRAKFRTADKSDDESIIHEGHHPAKTVNRNVTGVTIRNRAVHKSCCDDRMGNAINVFLNQNVRGCRSRTEEVLESMLLTLTRVTYPGDPVST